MKKKYILYLLLFIVIFGLIYIGSSIMANLRLGLTEVYVSKLNIPERTMIEENFIKKIKVPKAFIGENYYQSKDDIVGKYVKQNACVSKDSMFYKNLIESVDEMKDGVHTKLLKGQVTYDLFIKDISVNPAHLTEEMYVDLYLTINRKEVISDLLISGTKIIGLYDNKGQEIRANEINANLSTISIAINPDMVSYLNKAITIGEISIIVNSDLYAKREVKMNLSQDLLNYIG